MFNYLFNTYEQVRPHSQITLKDNNEEYSDEKLDEELDEDLENYDLEDIPNQFNTYLGVTNEIKPFSINYQEEKIDNSSIKPKQQEIKLKSSKEFEVAFQKACAINPEVQQYKIFLVKTAKRESGFNSHIQNTTGAPYYGYFQMGKDEIKRTTGLTVEEFRNNPVQQILGAVKLYKMNLSSIKRLGVYDIGRQRGYSDDALVAGAWMGGPGGVKKYLLGLGDPSDSHWYKKAGQKGGSSVGKIMNNWKENE